MHTRFVHPEGERGAGFALIEVIVSFSALLIVLLGFSRMLLSSRMASATTHEATLAKEAARALIEQLAALDVETAYQRYNSSTADDPGGGVVSPGASFAVRGLEALDDDADGLPGEILFPEAGGVLSESLVLPQYGWPIPMNGDGDTDDADVSGDFTLLPVVVRIRYRTAGGPGLVEFKTILGANG
jgi:hypothetical protein